MASETHNIMERRKIGVLIPAFNESPTVGGVIREVHEVLPQARIVVIDDGSRDETALRAGAAGAHVVSLPFNMGYGAALQVGFKYAVRVGIGHVVQIDSDGQHNARDMAAVLEPVISGEYDMVVGSRFLGGGAYRPTPLRRMGIWLFGRIASIMTGKKITDSTSGYKAFGPAAIRFNASENFPIDYPDADLIVMLHRSGMRFKEVPVEMYPSPPGKSMHGTALGSLYYVFRMFLSLIIILLRKSA